MTPTYTVLIDDVLAGLRSLPDQSVHMVITSPPYWGLRNYQAGSQEIGSEPSFFAHLGTLALVFQEIRRVLRDDGTAWLNYGDRFDKQGNLMMMPARVALMLAEQGWCLRSDIIWHKPNPMPESVTTRPTRSHEYLFLLSKGPTYYYDIEATKEPYADSTQREAQSEYTGQETKDYTAANAQLPSASKRRILESVRQGGGRQKRDVWVDRTSVWEIAVQPYRGGHFATFPEKLVEPCIQAGTSGGGACGTCGTPYTRIVDREAIPQAVKDAFEAARARTAADTGRTDGHTNYKPNFRRGSRTSGWMHQCPGDEPCTDRLVPCTVLDPFCGSGRAGMVARRLGRSFIGIELKPEYAFQALDNISSVEPPGDTDG